jgi:hypothetical protein
MLLHLLTAGFGTFETSLNIRSTAALGGDPDMKEQGSNSTHSASGSYLAWSTILSSVPIKSILTSLVHLS